MLGRKVTLALCSQIFTDNEELCRKVSKPELTLVFHIASTSDKHEELFTTLQAITKVSVAGL